LSDAATLKQLLDRRFVLVTGKGGTGKTTFAAALSVLGGVRGKRTLLCEVDTQRSSLAPIFGFEPGFEPENVRPGLDVCNLDWDGSLRMFLNSFIASRRVVSLILSNQIVGKFLDFTPGSQEIVLLSAIAQLGGRYDLVVVDMPASGHAFSLLDITRSALGLFRSGPVRARATELRELITDDDTAVAFVALPEEMVVNETMETLARMRKFGLLGAEPTVFLNRATLPSLSDPERQLLDRLSSADLTEEQSEFVLAGHWEDALEQATAASRKRLGEDLPTPPVLVGPAPPGGVPRTVVGSVAVALGRLVGVTRRELEWS
jgi:arsenite/tail-anchored protein-transporting ATPase